MRKLLSVLAALALASPLVLASQASAQDAGPQLALTFDDLPAHSALPPGQSRLQIAQDLIAALKDAGAPPIYGFVNAVQLTREPASAPVLDAWRMAGNPLGNHTFSHPNLNSIPLAQYLNEIATNEAVLQQKQPDADWRWFRYPFLAEGDDPAKRDGVRAYLAAHGYKIAGVTMSFGDYGFNEPYARCVAKNDTAGIARLETIYLDAAAKAQANSRAMAKALFGHDIPYVILMHIGAFDAHMAPRLLAQYKAEGFSLITLPQAEQDPFYKTDLDPSLPAGIDSLEGAMMARGLSLPPQAVDLNAVGRICS